MSNALDILKYDKRVEKFIIEIKDQELEANQGYLKSKLDRTTIFPQISEYTVSEGDKMKIVFVTNIRKVDKNGVWWRLHQEKAFIAPKDMLQEMKANYLKQFIVDSYNMLLNYIVPNGMMLHFIDEPADVKCGYQWLSEEDRMAAFSSMLSPAEYVIQKYMK